jgi:hypothetical protein
MGPNLQDIFPLRDMWVDERAKVRR